MLIMSDGKWQSSIHREGLAFIVIWSNQNVLTPNSIGTFEITAVGTIKRQLGKQLSTPVEIY